MKPSAERVGQALKSNTRVGMIDLLRPRRPDLSLIEIRRLTQHLRTIGDVDVPLKVAILRTYSTELLGPYWTFEAVLNGFGLDVYEAPYGFVIQETAADSGLRQHRPDLTYIFLRWEDLDARLAWPLSGLSTSERETVADVALGYLTSLLRELRDAVPGLIIATLLPPMHGAELGSYDAMAGESEATFRSRFKQRLAKRLGEGFPSVHFCDLDTVVEEVGRANAFDARLWHSARFPFTVRGAQAVVRRLMTYPILVKRPVAKVIVLDADNTLWGGVVGEDGLYGIRLGPEYPGALHVAFQRRLLDFQRRGLLLALCSKNNPGDVDEVLRTHSHQILRVEHFAAMRVNWNSKVENLRAIAAELNLGLDSFLFVDDSPHECLAVRQQLPQVEVVQVPEDVTLLPGLLDEIPRLEILSLTDEDRQRTQMYAQERKRRELQSSVSSVDDYLRSLQMMMTIAVDHPQFAARIAQLTQKTNQFNVTTRRYNEAEIQRFMQDQSWLVASFSLADIFGDSGLVGVALIRQMSASDAEIDTFLMSCRVIGREAERAFFYRLSEQLRQRGLRRLYATYTPTPKNDMVKDLWPRLGFQTTSPNQYELDLARAVLGERELPVQINLINGPAIGSESLVGHATGLSSICLGGSS